MYKAALITAVFTNTVPDILAPSKITKIYNIIRLARRAAPEPINGFPVKHVAHYLAGGDYWASEISPTWRQAQQDIRAITGE